MAQASSSPSPSEDEEDELFKKLGLSTFFDRQSKKQNEIDVYLHQGTVPYKKPVLDYWKGHDMDFPILSKIARDLFAISVSTVPAERFFSRAGLIIRKHRTRLSDANSRSLICLNSWAAHNNLEQLEKYGN